MKWQEMLLRQPNVKDSEYDGNRLVHSRHTVRDYGPRRAILHAHLCQYRPALRATVA